MCSPATAQVWRYEENLWESVSYLHHWDLNSSHQAWCKQLYPMNPLPDFIPRKIKINRSHPNIFSLLTKSSSCTLHRHHSSKLYIGLLSTSRRTGKLYWVHLYPAPPQSLPNTGSCKIVVDRIHLCAVHGPCLRRLKIQPSGMPE